MKRGMEPFLVLNRTISSKSVHSQLLIRNPVYVSRFVKWKCPKSRSDLKLDVVLLIVIVHHTVIFTGALLLSSLTAEYPCRSKPE